MNTFERDFNVLMAKLERNLSGESGWHFWSGYLAGFMEFSAKISSHDFSQRVFSADREKFYLYKIGRAVGWKGKSVIEATAIFDRIMEKRSNQSTMFDCNMISQESF